MTYTIGNKQYLIIAAGGHGKLGQVFALIATEHEEKGQPLPSDTTEIVHA